LTLRLLSAARVALFLVTGEGKREAVRRLLAGDESIPAALVQAQRVVLVADRAALG
jgi:6-phosphogluconolactonase